MAKIINEDHPVQFSDEDDEKENSKRMLNKQKRKELNGFSLL
jgi:hypothetical protein